MQVFYQADQPRVSMIVTGIPQFQTQDDFGIGEGIRPILHWQVASRDPNALEQNLGLDVDPAISQILSRLRIIFHPPAPPLTNMELHDLTCFVMHRLLLLPPFPSTDPQRSATSESLRSALALYILTIHGATYYAHVDLALAILERLKHHLTSLVTIDYIHDSLRLWILSVGLIASIGTPHRQWFVTQTCVAVEVLTIRTWDDVLDRLKDVLWIESLHEQLFRQKYEEIIRVMTG